MVCPCKDCSDRHELCHSDCEKYREWKEQKDRVRAMRREEKSISDALFAGPVERKERWMKSMKKRGRSKVKN